jgi:hypothetical protein
MTGTHHHAVFSVEMGSRQLFGLGWAAATILLISASQVARFTGVNYTQFEFFFFFFFGTGV